MCDYSLNNVASRSAKVGDKLTSTSFSGSFSHGFAGIGEPDVAVCVLPGTELAFDKDVATRKFSIFGIGGQTFPHRVARFRQLHREDAHRHHDALEFPDGTTVMLHELAEGQNATVLQLPSAPRTDAEAEEQRRVEVVG
jgi:hypothetical protein